MKQFIEDRVDLSGMAPHAGLRTDGYVLLAALLLDKPSEAAITLVQNMSWSDDLPESMQEALADLNHAGSRFSNKLPLVKNLTGFSWDWVVGNWCPMRPGIGRK